LPRTAEDFSSIDAGEQKNFSYGFGPQGQSNRPLAAGEIITSVTFQMFVVSGIDATPSARLIGSAVVQTDGITVTQKVGNCIAGVVYLIVATALTNVPGSQDLIVYSDIKCNAIG
jgi:hypothetical protein